MAAPSSRWTEPGRPPTGCSRRLPPAADLHQPDHPHLRRRLLSPKTWLWRNTRACGSGQNATNDRNVTRRRVSICCGASVESAFASFRKPLVSSCEMDRKMADRRLIRLSQVPERLTREKLEESDWVTFAVLVNKVTPQSSSSVSASS